MATVKNVYDFLDGLWHFDNMPEYDNSGLLIGSGNEKVSSVLTCLDITADVIEQATAVNAELIVSHHPIIFDPVKSVLPESPLYKAISRGIAVISLHIPIDEAVNGANKALCELIGLKAVSPFGPKPGNNGDTICEGWVGELTSKMSADEFATSVARTLKTDLTYCAGDRPIQNVVVCGGSGGFLASQVVDSGYDCLVSSRIKHSDMLYALSHGVTLIDATHFATEIHITRLIAEKLSERFSGEGIRISVAVERNPVKAICLGGKSDGN